MGTGIQVYLLNLGVMEITTINTMQLVKEELILKTLAMEGEVEGVGFQMEIRTLHMVPKGALAI